MKAFMKEAGRYAARLTLRRTGWLLVVTAATFPVWHYPATLRMSR